MMRERFFQVMLTGDPDKALQLLKEIDGIHNFTGYYYSLCQLLKNASPATALDALNSLTFAPTVMLARIILMKGTPEEIQGLKLYQQTRTKIFS